MEGSENSNILLAVAKKLENENKLSLGNIQKNLSRKWAGFSGKGER